MSDVGTEERPRRMIDIDKVLDIVPMSRATLYRMVEQKKFPPSTCIGGKLRFWYEDEIVAWQKQLGYRRVRRPSASPPSASSQ